MKTTLLSAFLKDLFTTMPGTRSAGTNAAQRVSGTHWVHSLKPLLLLVVFGLVAFSALAQNIRYVKPTATGTGDGLSWANASGNLQTMINAITSGQQVRVAAGIFKPTTTTNRAISFAMKEGVTILGGFAGTGANPDARTPLSTTLSGNIGDPNSNTDNSYHVVYNPPGLTSDAILDGFVITGGNANGVYPDNFGGGMYNDGRGTRQVCSPLVRNCTFQGNTASFAGGAMVNNGNEGGYSSPLLTNCAFEGNTADFRGGAMYNDGFVGISNPSLTNCAFQGNTASAGGAMYNKGVVGISNPSLTNCAFQGNTAYYYGGAMYNDGSGGISNPSLTNCAFQGNTASANGGAMYNDGRDLNDGLYSGTSNTSLTNCVLFGNGGNNTFYNELASVSASYSLFDASVTGYTGIPGNLTVTVSPFASTTSTQLKACSPAIDAGYPTATTLSVSLTDLADNPRFFGGRIDMGAYEFSTFPTRLYVRAGANGANTGLNWTDAFPDLQSALSPTCGNSLTAIWVAAGIYKPTSTTARTVSFAMKNGVTILGGFAGTGANPDARTPLSTTLSGNIGDPNSNTDNSYHVVYNPPGLTSDAILDGFVITGGNANGVYPDNFGGGMYNNGRGSGQVCSPLVRNCTFQDNTAAAGGAMFNFGESGTSNPSLTNCTFQGNTASDNGGAMYNVGYSGTSNPTLTNCTFQGNTASDNGGAMYNDGQSGSANPILTNCTFQGNTAPYAGAIYTTANGGVSRTTLINCILFGNGGANTFAGTPGISARYSLFDASVTSYTSGPGNLTVTTSPFASTTSTQLYAYSPAMDTGDPATTTATVGATDLAGNARVFGSRIDMGAYEFNGPFPSKIYVRAGATGANTGQNWADAFTDLQSALTMTTSGSSLTAIWVAAGIYKPTSTTARNISFAMRNGVTILGGFAGTGVDPDVRTPLSSTLSGDIGIVNNNTDNSYHVFNNPAGLTGTAILDGFVITGGKADGSSNGYGAGMYNTGGGAVCSPMLRNCLFQNNSASLSGGAIYNDGVSGISSPALINCAFQNNLATYGGAILNDGQYGNANPSLTNCTFQGNTAPYAGAIYTTANGGVSRTNLVNCVLFGNGGANTFAGTPGISARYSLFDASVTSYTSGPGNLTTTISPFASTTNTQLAACSPAINAGSNAAINATGLTTDIIGNTRFYDGIVDMGAYEFNSPLPVPTNLGVGTPAATSVVVTWTMTPATVPTEIRWRAIGTTAWSSATTTAGITTYAITGLIVETTYEWQVRPNCPATPGYVSGSNFATSPYCRPTYSNGCNVGDALTSFSLDNVALSQGSGCSPGSFTYVTTNRQVALGQPVTVSGIFSSNSSEGVAIWADLNRNNVFESTEILYQRSPAAGPFSGTLSIPAGTATGSLRIRVFVAFDTTPVIPCGSYGYGETEDYLITVTSGTTCTVMTTIKTGTWNDPTVWSCNRVPTATDAVTVGHVVAVPAGITSTARKIVYGAGGRLSFSVGSTVRLGF